MNNPMRKYMRKSTAIVAMVVIGFVCIVAGLNIGTYQADKIGLQALKTQMKQCTQEKKEIQRLYEWEIARYIILVDKQQAKLREICQEGYIPPESSPDIERVSRGK